MRKKKILLAGMIVLMNTVFLSGCGKSHTEPSKKIHVGVTYYNQSDTFLNELLGDFKESLKKLEDDQMRTSVTILDAAGSQRTQDDQVKELIDMGCDVLCVNLVDRADPSEIIDLARENNIPIIFFNREPVAEDLSQWEELYYIGAEAKQSGIMQGELAAQMIFSEEQIDRNKDGKIQYVVLEGEAGHQDSIIRTRSAAETLQNSGVVLEKLSYQIANWNRVQAQNRMEQMLEQYQNKIELVLANNDDMALGAIDAYKKANYTESAWPVFFGIDGTKLGLKALADGDLSGTVYNDKEGQAKMMAEMVKEVGTGKEIEEKYIYLPYVKVTNENVKEFMEEE